MARRTGARDSRSRARPPVRIETSAGGVVYRAHEGRYLFLLIRDPYENWGLPKGHLERGETPDQAAMREVCEETGLSEVDVGEQLDTIDWFFREGADLIHKYCHFFLMRTEIEETEPQREEGITECVWLPLEEALSTLSYDNAREVLEAAGRKVLSGPDDG